ncbi:error-prone DNA polymerase [Sinomonas halotolerans]|uniref:Error-prone DNA polymerase n=1 Tax=Sinomonas halotolerans TaxID=1644133 RepID=A0ABU9WYH0_9MICC
MGWNNPAIPWQELHDLLEGKGVSAERLQNPKGSRGAGAPKTDAPPAGLALPGPRPAGPVPGRAPIEHDGGDSPAWSRKRGPYLPVPGLQSASARGEDAAHGEGTAGGESPASCGEGPAHTQASLGSPAVPYAELHVHSHYSFLDGASSPEELVEEAVRLGLSALAVTDHDGFYGAVRLAEAAEAYGLATVFGAELSLGLSGPQNGAPDPEGEHLLVLARGEEGYHRLAGAITAAQLAEGAEKGRPVYRLEELAQRLRGHCMVLTGCRKGAVRRALAAHGEAGAERAIAGLVDLFGAGGVAVELFDHGSPRDSADNDALAALAARAGLPCVATNAVHHAQPEGHRLASAMAAVRARRSLDELDGWLPASDGAHLRSGAEMAERFGRYPGAVENTVRIAQSLAFRLRSARPRLPTLDVPAGHTTMTWLRELVEQGLVERYGTPGPAWHGPVPPEEVRARIEQELAVIEAKDFPGYFLIVHGIVQFARGRGILCQGRGSAANSAVCYFLGITAVDSIYYRLPFERFLSSLREEEPDIDVDFDSDRREEVIQHVYATYGRANAAQVANVISYRPKNAVRDAAKALGYSQGQQDAWSKRIERWDALSAAAGQEGTEAGDAGIPAHVVELAEALLGAPRHLGIHSGGMVLTQRPVGEVVPIEHARMEGRTVLQWDKDDCEWMGLVKFDLLGLGMLAALQYCFDLIRDHLGEEWEIATLPREEPAVYDMLCRADSVGVFQVESRAQMSTLPRLQPRRYYDLVVEIALIRPGPIQGGAVHPYIRRRAGEEPVTYPHPLLEPVLERTLGVPLFQEQLMQMAMAVGGCTAEDADLLRRAMGSKRGVERIGSLREKLFEGMAANGLSPEESRAIYAQIAAFADFGFAESHSLSFAVLVYASSWLKLHYPAAFLAALLRAQPMGFYSPQSLVADARRHGVTVRRPCILRSRAEPTLEPLDGDAAGQASPGGTPVPPGNGPDPQRSGPRATGMDSCLESRHLAEGEEPERFDPDAPDESDAHRRDAGHAVRLGLAAVAGIGAEAAERVVAEREANGPYTTLSGLARRTGLTAAQLEALATAGAFESLGLSRREALWQAGAAALERPGQLPGTQPWVQPPLLPELGAEEALAGELWATGVATEDHPLRHARRVLEARGVLAIDCLGAPESGTRVEAAGLVTHRQRPSTAQGVTFLSLEDETGLLNVVCSVGVWARYRRVAQSANAMVVRGILERTKEGVVNLVADRLEVLPLRAKTASRDFR